MHLQITEEQDALRDAVAGFLDKASSFEAVREAEPLGWDPKVWAGLTDMGVPTLGVSEDLGGSGASLRDIAVVAEACGARLASAPVIETLVAARLLARFAEPAGAHLTDLIEGGGPVVLALHPAVKGTARLVPGAAVAASVVALDGDDGERLAGVRERRDRRAVSRSGTVGELEPALIRGWRCADRVGQRLDGL